MKTLINKIENYIKIKVHNPLSTMSNLSYVLFGYISLSINPVLGILMIFLGIASAGFHWKRSRCWHEADIVAIYYQFAVIASWLILGNWGLPLGFLVGGIAHYSFRNGYRGKSQDIIGVLFISCLIPFIIQNGWYDTICMLQWFVYAMGVSMIANKWNPEENGKWYDVFHAIWHIFSAIGIYYLII